MTGKLRRAVSMFLVAILLFSVAVGVSVAPVSAKEGEVAEVGIIPDYYMDVGDSRYIYLGSTGHIISSAFWTSNASDCVQITYQTSTACQIEVVKYTSFTVIIECRYTYYKTNPLTGISYPIQGSEHWYVEINEEDTYVTISFDTGTYQTLSSKTIRSGSAIGTLPVPYRENYEFNGWYVDTPSYYKRVWSDTTFTEDTTLYADWKYVPPVEETEATQPTTILTQPTETVANKEEYTYTDGDYGTYKYTVNDYGVATITGYTIGAESSIEIPSEIDGYAVGYIGESAFQEAFQLKSVVIPKGVMGIEAYAFKNCDKLEKISLPEGLITIGNGAFSGCPSLKYVSLPEGLETLGEEAFYRSTNLKDIYIPKSTTEIGDNAIANCHDEITVYGYVYSPAHKHAYGNNYNFVIVNEYTDENSGIEVSPLPTDKSLFSIADVSEPEEIEEVNALLTGESVDKIYDILLDENVMPLDLSVRFPGDDNQKVYRVESDGSLAEIDSSYDNGNYVFNTDSPGRFVLTVEDSEVATTEITTNVTSDPSEATTETVTKPSESVPSDASDGKILGDADDNGKVTIKDATVIQKYLAKLAHIPEEREDVCDVDGNDKLNIKDATNIQKWLAKIDIEYPVGETMGSNVIPAASSVTEEATEAPATKATTEQVEETVVTEATEAPATEESTEVSLSTEATEQDEPLIKLLKINTDDGNYVAEVGEKVTYSIMLKTNEPITAIDAHLSYDTTKLKVSGESAVRCPNLVAGAVVPSVNVMDDGKILFLAASANNPLSFDTSKVLIAVDFEVIGTGETDISYNIADMIKSSSDNYYNKGQCVDPDGMSIVTVIEKTEDAEAESTEPATEAETEPATDTRTIFFIDTWQWGKAYVSYWNENESSDWPGKEMTYCGKNDMGQPKYSYDIPVDMTTMIFTDGDVKQTVDIDLTGTTNNFFIADRAENGKYICDTF